MFVLLIPLIGCFTLGEGNKTVLLVNDANMMLRFDRKHVVGDSRASSVTFGQVEDKMYDIKFDGVSVCARFPEKKIVGCDGGKWELRPDGPFFNIITKNGSGQEYCWVRSKTSLKNKIRLEKCAGDEIRFKIEDEDLSMPAYKRAMKTFGRFVFSFFDNQEDSKGWDEELGSSSGSAEASSDHESSETQKFPVRQPPYLLGSGHPLPLPNMLDPREINPVGNGSLNAMHQFDTPSPAKASLEDLDRGVVPNMLFSGHRFVVWRS